MKFKKKTAFAKTEVHVVTLLLPSFSFLATLEVNKVSDSAPRRWIVSKPRRSGGTGKQRSLTGV